jgi:cytochrome b subunit of formate dehydrogenase
MKKFVYRLAYLVAIITFLINVFSGITILTSLFRSVIVFLLMLLLTVIGLKILRWSLMLSENTPKNEVVESEKK